MILSREREQVDVEIDLMGANRDVKKRQTQREKGRPAQGIRWTNKTEKPTNELDFCLYKQTDLKNRQTDCVQIAAENVPFFPSLVT